MVSKSFRNTNKLEIGIVLKLHMRNTFCTDECKEKVLNHKKFINEIFGIQRKFPFEFSQSIPLKVCLDL